MATSSAICMKDFYRLCALQKSFAVIFMPQWQRKDHQNALITQLQSWITNFFSVIVDINDAAEDYVINNLYVKALPYMAFYERGRYVHGMAVDARNITDLLQPLRQFLAGFKNEKLMAYTSNLTSNHLFQVLFHHDDGLPEKPIRIFISGDRSSVGKSSTCLALLSGLVTYGVNPGKLAYIKPATQCEAEQPVAKYCQEVGIQHRSIGPVVFYQGFTRAFLAGETPTAAALLQSIVRSVEDIEKDKSIVLIDGVGYPSVGSICNVSNGHVAAALHAPVVLVGKSGVGDAVDSYNLNAAYLESFGVTIMGGIFNKIDREGFYNIQACKQAVTSYFQQFKPSQLPYGFVPKVSAEEMSLTSTEPMEVDAAVNDLISVPAAVAYTHWTRVFMQHVDLGRLIHDAWISNIATISVKTLKQSDQQLPMIVPQTESSNLIGVDKSEFKVVGSKRTRQEIEEEARIKGAMGG